MMVLFFTYVSFAISVTSLLLSLFIILYGFQVNTKKLSSTGNLSISDGRSMAVSLLHPSQTVPWLLNQSWGLMASHIWPESLQGLTWLCCKFHLFGGRLDRLRSPPCSSRIYSPPSQHLFRLLAPSLPGKHLSYIREMSTRDVTLVLQVFHVLVLGLLCALDIIPKRMRSRGVFVITDHQG